MPDEYEVQRFRRAWQLVKTGRVEQVGHRQFRVAGNEEPVYDVALDGDPPCYCLDSYYGGTRRCKHFLASAIVAKDEQFVNAVVAMFFATLEEETE
jgi:hypothetical protein